MFYVKTIVVMVLLPMAALFLALCATDQSVAAAVVCIGGMFAIEAWTEGGTG